MNANELRIGNLIGLHKEAIYSVVSISDEFLDLYGVSENVKYHDFKNVLIDEDMRPIPLTEEWLLKFGFEITKSELHNLKQIYNGYISFNTYINFNGEESYLWLRYYQNGTTPKLKYVHQLQNLYFALTGKELPI